MTSSGRPQVVVLCEDRTQYHFVRKYLQLHGITDDRIVLRKYPGGRGAGEQWVRRRYAQEVRAYRSRASYRDVALAVIVDADRYAVAARKRQLETSPEMAECGQSPRTRAERIAVFVPKWSVETWFAFLEGSPWNEEESLKARHRDSSPTKCAKALADRCRDQQSIDDAPPSLQDACDEWPRLSTH